MHSIYRGLIRLALLSALTLHVSAQSNQALSAERVISGTVVTATGQVVVGATIITSSAAGELHTTTDTEGRFTLSGSSGATTLRVEGRNLAARTVTFKAEEKSADLKIEVEYLIPQVHDSLVISASQLDPVINRRNEAIYRNTLFSRDDQIFHTLDAGLNAGQHEGGGKSLEIRRFGFNLDHGGVSGGLKVLVDNFQQNQGTQGHGQGYLGQLKSLTPELVQDVEIINGPFNAEYGDFSGLGVVHIRLKDALPEQLIARMQGGSFGSLRGFLGYSPDWKQAKAIIAYEASRTDGPFLNPLDYARDNLSGNYVRTLSPANSFALKFNLGRNNFTSSGQIPLDEVFAGRLERFGFLDPDNGGRVHTGVANFYFKREAPTGSVLKFDGFIARSLFDLYSNFTFFLNDPARGDEIRQHDSRLQEGANAQLLHPYTLFGGRALFTAGANYHDNQINVGLDQAVRRTPVEAITKANARVINVAGYAQQALHLLQGHIHVEAGLRYDYFRFRVDDRIDPTASGVQGAARLQPKFTLAVTPTDRWPATFYFNYGRGISSQDARGVVQQPTGERISTTDFYQTGAAFNFTRVSVAGDLFLIDRSNEQVYIPDDGSFEFKGPSRAYGFEAKASLKLSRYLALNGGVTKVMNSFYRGTAPRVYVDSAPHVTSNAGLTLDGWHELTSSLRYRHISNYRLDGEDASLRASGFDVIDFSLTRRLHRRLDLNFSIDNLTNKRYFETQNFFASRISPNADAVERIHATPGYPRTFTIGLTFRVGAKD